MVKVGRRFIGHEQGTNKNISQPRSQGPLLLGPCGEGGGRVGEDPGNEVVHFSMGALIKCILGILVDEDLLTPGLSIPPCLQILRIDR